MHYPLIVERDEWPDAADTCAPLAKRRSATMLFESSSFVRDGMVGYKTACSDLDGATDCR
jgi:hypothetical protein